MTVFSIVDAVEDLRKIRQAGLPFKVVCFEVAPHEILAFNCFKPEIHLMSTFSRFELPQSLRERRLKREKLAKTYY